MSQPTPKHTPIPRTFPVQPLRTREQREKATDLATCGTCGLFWDDAIPTEWTPVPSARCPFEYFHIDEDTKPYETTIEQYNRALQNLITASEALADQEEATLSLDETRGNQKRVTPANMFLSVGRSDIRAAIADARALLED